MSAAKYDVIVIGVGGMGSATCFELARRGVRVLGLEQFDIGHDRGSSHGQTRVIRTAYYEHPSYVPLVRRSFERWYDLEQRTDRKLLTECGCVNIGRAGSMILDGVRQAAREHGLRVKELSGVELREWCPPLRFGDDYCGALEREAGFLFVEECVRAHADAAHSMGATIETGVTVREWTATPLGVRVVTDGANFEAGRLVITVGPWAGELLQSWGKPLTVMRQTMLWFGTQDDSQFRRNRFPIYLAEVPEGYFYGLPVIDAAGHKVARHYGAPESAKPDDFVRDVTESDEVPVREFLNRYLPQVNGPLNRAQVCTYTMTPDRHFILDRHPEHDNVAIAAGFSGHGFKFAPVVGEIMADLVLEGRTKWPIDVFRITRFLANPAR
jgi:sarcosine oxidase